MSLLCSLVIYIIVFFMSFEDLLKAPVPSIKKLTAQKKLMEPGKFLDQCKISILIWPFIARQKTHLKNSNVLYVVTTDKCLFIILMDLFFINTTMQGTEDTAAAPQSNLLQATVLHLSDKTIRNTVRSIVRSHTGAAGPEILLWQDRTQTHGCLSVGHYVLSAPDATKYYQRQSRRLVMMHWSRSVHW